MVKNTWLKNGEILVSTNMSFLFTNMNKKKTMQLTLEGIELQIPLNFLPMLRIRDRTVEAKQRIFCMNAPITFYLKPKTF